MTPSLNKTCVVIHHLLKISENHPKVLSFLGPPDDRNHFHTGSAVWEVHTDCRTLAADPHTARQPSRSANSGELTVKSMPKRYQSLPSWQLTFPTQCMFQDDFLFPRWDILVSWRVHTYYNMFNFLTPFAVCSPPHCKFDCRIGLACHSLDSGLPKVGQTWVRSFITSIRFVVSIQNLGSGFGTKILGTHISKVEDSNVSFWFILT